MQNGNNWFTIPDHTSTHASWKMDRIQRERQMVLLLKQEERKKNGGHVKQMIVLNRIRQDAEGFARIVTMNSCSISPEAIWHKSQKTLQAWATAVATMRRCHFNAVLHRMTDVCPFHQLHTWLHSKKGSMIWKLRWRISIKILNGVYCIWNRWCAIVRRRCYIHIASVRGNITWWISRRDSAISVLRHKLPLTTHQGTERREHIKTC